MSTLTQFILLVSLSYSAQAFAQSPDSLVKKLDSLRETEIFEENNTSQKAYNEITEIHFDTYFILLGSNFKQQLTAPFKLSKKDWLNVGKFGLVTFGLGFADEPVYHFGNNLRNNNEGVRSASRIITNMGAQYEGITLAALGAYGFLFKNEKIQTTTLLASQAYITSSVMQGLIKTITGRQRPSYFDPVEMEAEPKFHGPVRDAFRDASGNRMSSSFPSGHTTVAFAAATVYAMEFKDKPLVPIISYTLASLIGLSRITENRHWATDVFAGAALGHLIGRQVVNNYHRYARLRNEKQKKNHVSFSPDYRFGQLMPGIVYSIR